MLAFFFRGNSPVYYFPKNVHQIKRQEHGFHQMISHLCQACQSREIWIVWSVAFLYTLYYVKLGGFFSLTLIYFWLTRWCKFRKRQIKSDATKILYSLFSYTGAGIFVTTVVAGSIQLRSSFKLARRPFIRDVVIYLSAVGWTFAVMYRKEIQTAEAVGLYQFVDERISPYGKWLVFFHILSESLHDT